MQRDPQVRALHWEPFNGVDHSRLYASLNVMGTSMHCIAIQLKEEDGMQMAVNEDHNAEFEKVFDASGSDGHWRTVEIAGKDYGVYITPFCE